VLKELVSIQRNFLWGGGRDSKKVCWVSCDRICQWKEKGDLGIKNLELFNSSLLCKWKWRCLNDKVAPWYDLLKFRYGSFAITFLYGEGKEGLNLSLIYIIKVLLLIITRGAAFFCFNTEETIHHFFLNCCVNVAGWREIYK
jgi:hypothetical protein